MPRTSMHLNANRRCLCSDLLQSVGTTSRPRIATLIISSVRPAPAHHAGRRARPPHRLTRSCPARAQGHQGQEPETERARLRRGCHGTPLPGVTSVHPCAPGRGARRRGPLRLVAKLARQHNLRPTLGSACQSAPHSSVEALDTRPVGALEARPAPATMAGGGVPCAPGVYDGREFGCRTRRWRPPDRADADLRASAGHGHLAGPIPGDHRATHGIVPPGCA